MRLNLTHAEKVFAHRMAKKMTQRAAAEHWHVGFWVYRSWEENPNAVPVRVQRKLSNLDVTRQLRYIILRRRHGMTQSDLGVELKVSRQWVNRMEMGLESDQLLRNYWAS